MEEKTRDNLIYLAVGLSIAGLLAVDAFYSASRDHKMWMPSRFALRTVAYMVVLAYFVAQETLKVRATIVQTVLCVLVACIMHLGIVILFRQAFSNPFNLGLWVLITLELFLVSRLMSRAVVYFRRVNDP